MSETLVNKSIVAVAVQEMDSNNKKINATLDEYTAKMEAMKAQWDGDAREQYAVAKAKWDKSMQNMNEILAQVPILLQQSSDTFDTIDKRGANRFA